MAQVTWAIAKPADKDNTIPLYTLVWNRGAKRGSNFWMTKKLALQAKARLEAEGCVIIETKISYCAGFAF